MKPATALYNGIVGTNILRGLLALAVALHHADIFRLGYFPLMSGRTAVISFFVLSGWVMTWFFAGQGRTVTWPVAFDFWLRRIFRLGPVLFINFVLVCFVMTKLMPWELIGLLPIYPEPLPKFFNHILWTLVVEIEFYVIVPVLAAWFLPKLRQGMTALAVYLGLFILPRVIAVIQGLPLESALDARSFAGNLPYFLAGMWYCLRVCQGNPTLLTRLSVPQLALYMGIAWGLAALLYALNTVLYGVLGVHAAVAGAVMAIELSRRFDIKPSTLPVVLKGLYHLGVLSFGYYVFHGFFLGMIENNVISFQGTSIKPYSVIGVVLLVISPLLVAQLIFWLVEKPVELLKRNILQEKGVR